MFVCIQMVCFVVVLMFTIIMMNSFYDTIASKICASIPSVLACGMSVGDLPEPTPIIYSVSIYSARHSTA